MSVTLESLEGLKRQLSVTIPAEDLQKAYKERLQKTTKTIRMDGFRPGKVPLAMVEQRFGEHLLHETAVELMQNALKEAVESNQLMMAGSPEVKPEEIKLDQPLVFTASFEVFPEVVVQDCGAISVEKRVAEIAESDLEKTLENLRKGQTEWTNVDRAAQTGDRVSIDFEGTVDDQPIERGSAKDFQLELGSRSMIPGFEEGIEGMKVGEVKDITAQFPEQYGEKNLAGKPALFKITLKRVEEPKLPELNDEFSRKLGMENLQQLRERVQERMQKEVDNLLWNHLKKDIFKHVLELHQFDVPSALIKDEIKGMKQGFLQQFAAQTGQKMPDFSKLDLPDDLFKDEASKRVKLGLLMREIIQAHQIKPEADRIRDRIMEVASSYAQPEEVLRWYYGNEQKMAEIQTLVLEDMVAEKLLAGMGINEIKQPYADAVEWVKKVSEEQQRPPVQEDQANEEKSAESEKE